MKFCEFKYDFSRQRNTFEKCISLVINPGVQALFLYRLSNVISKLKYVNSTAWLIYRLNHFLTGADIHPHAEIGKNIIIYHSVGIVIGETAVIKDGVKIMHGVTLGTDRLDIKGKRHPTVNANVLLGCNSAILGNIVIGENSIIGANSVVLNDIKPNSIAVGIPAKEIKNNL